MWSPYLLESEEGEKERERDKKKQLWVTGLKEEWDYKSIVTGHV